MSRNCVPRVQIQLFLEHFLTYKPGSLPWDAQGFQERARTGPSGKRHEGCSRAWVGLQ